MLSENRGFQRHTVRRTAATSHAALCGEQAHHGRCARWGAEVRLRNGFRAAHRAALAEAEARQAQFAADAASIGVSVAALVASLCEEGDDTALRHVREQKAPPPPALGVLLAPKLRHPCRACHLPAKLGRLQLRAALRVQRAHGPAVMLATYDPTTQLLLAYLAQRTMRAPAGVLFPKHDWSDAVDEGLIAQRDAEDSKERGQHRRRGGAEPAAAANAEEIDPEAAAAAETARLAAMELEVTIVREPIGVYDLSHLPQLLPLFARRLRAQQRAAPAATERAFEVPDLESLDVDFHDPAFVTRVVAALLVFAQRETTGSEAEAAARLDAEAAAGEEEGEDADAAGEEGNDAASDAASNAGSEAGKDAREAAEEEATSTVNADNADDYLVHTLVLRRCDIDTLDVLVSAMKIFGVARGLRCLDVADNRIESLGVLWALQAAFPRLVRLSLAANRITRKPTYREQVRATLPRLFELDGECVRRPALALPYPALWSDARVHDAAVETVASFFEAVESHRFDDDWARKHFHPSATFSVVAMPGCQVFDPLRYGETFDRTLEDPPLSAIDRKELLVMGVALTNATRNLLLGKPALHRQWHGPMCVAEGYAATIYPDRFDVDHCLGHAEISVVHMPNQALVPPRAAPRPVPRDLASAAAAAAATAAAAASATKTGKPGKKDKSKPEPVAPAPALATAVFAPAARRPEFHVVTLHGVMVWRTPSMKGCDGVRLLYDRTLTVVAVPVAVSETPVASVGRKRARSSSAAADGAATAAEEAAPRTRLVIYNDAVVLRPPPVPATTAAPTTAGSSTTSATTLEAGPAPSLEGCAVFSPFTESRLRQLSDMFGIPIARRSGTALGPLSGPFMDVLPLIERSTSDAALFAALAEASASSATVGAGSMPGAPTRGAGFGANCVFVPPAAAATAAAVALEGSSDVNGAAAPILGRDASAAHIATVLERHRSLSVSLGEVGLAGAPKSVSNVAAPSPERPAAIVAPVVPAAPAEQNAAPRPKRKVK